MKTIPLGNSSLISSRLGYGCWRIAAPWEGAPIRPDRLAHGQEAVVFAFEQGFTLFDLADIYADGMSETVFGEVLKSTPGMRDQILIATKCGIRKSGVPLAHHPYRYDFSKAHIIESCEQSLQRLGVTSIDLYQLHRPDYLGDPDEVSAAFEALHQAGKVRAFGLSNCRPSIFAAYQKICRVPLVVNQVEIHLFHLDALNDGILDQCQAERITPIAWSPLAGGRLPCIADADLSDPQHARKAKLREVLDKLARQYGITRAALCLAWLLRHPSGIVPLIGTTNPTHISEAKKALEIDLTREDWYTVLEAAIGHRLP